MIYDFDMHLRSGLLALWYGGQTQTHGILVKDLHGKTVVEIFNGYAEMPRLAPDGRRLTYSAKGCIYVHLLTLDESEKVIKVSDHYDKKRRSFMINTIEHIAIAASDPAVLADWYCNTLGFTMVVARPESKTFFVGVPGGGIVEIIAVDPKAQGQGATHTVGLHHLALAVSDFAGVAQTLQAQGIRFIGPAYRSDDGGTQFDFFCDPEGNRLQLVQRARPLGT